MKDFLKRNSVFIGLSLMLIIALGLAVALIPRGELHMLLCNHHTPARDIFFRYYTHIAEWLPYALCLLIFLFGRAGHAALAASCIACSELTTQIIKHIVQAPRPLLWFANNQPDIHLPLVEGVKMNYLFSFPSGHTTSFFALFFALTMVVTSLHYDHSKQKEPTYWQSFLYTILIPLTLFILAVLGGYSRIYLSQHFAQDVLGGMSVGLVISIVCYTIFSKFEGQKWYNYHFFAKKVQKNLVE